MSFKSHLADQLSSKSEKLGELLLKHTSLSDNQLQEALSIQQQEGGLLGEILLQKNFIHPHDIIKILCKQHNITYRQDVRVEDIDPAVVKDIPINYAKRHEILPIIETDFSVTVAVSDPFRSEALNDLQVFFNKPIEVVVSTPLKIQESINRIYEKANKNLVDSIEDEFEENLDLDGPIDILDASADEAPVIRFVNSIIFRAVKERASDIHIEPFEKETLFRFRINGVMKEVLRQPKKNPCRR